MGDFGGRGVEAEDLAGIEEVGRGGGEGAEGGDVGEWDES